MVGFFYEYGMGDLEINKKTALKYYKKAADLGNIAAKNTFRRALPKITFTPHSGFRTTRDTLMKRVIIIKRTKTRKKNCE